MRKGRRFSREILLQSLYEADFGQRDLLKLVDERTAEVGMSDPDFQFARHLAFAVSTRVAEIDERISATARQWPIGQMSRIDVALLRLGIAELLLGEVPAPVTINEAVELAKRYGSDASGRFVNGVLGTVSRSLVQDAAVAEAD